MGNKNDLELFDILKEMLKDLCSRQKEIESNLKQIDKDLITLKVIMGIVTTGFMLVLSPIISIASFFNTCISAFFEI